MGERERKIETYLNEQVSKILKGTTRKWTSPGYDGVPDRIVIFNGNVWFVEVKTTDGKLSLKQKREMTRLRKYGANVIYIFGKKDVDKFIENRLKEIGKIMVKRK